MRASNRNSRVAGTVLTLLMVAGTAGAADDPGLVDAARSQDSSKVRALVDRKADVNMRSADGSTALLWAAHWNDVASAELLLRARADANIANDFGMTPLSRACTNGSAPLVDLLLKAGANPNAAIATGDTPLMTCAGSGSVEAVRLLIARVAASIPGVEYLLIARGADVNAKEPSQDQSALMWAAAEHHADVVRLLVEAGADLQAHTKKGFTAIHFAARDGDLATTRALLSAGVSINIRSQQDEPEAPAREAAPTGRSVSGAATTAGAPRGPGYQATLSAGSTPLLVATVRGHVPLALFLLEQGADPNVLDAGFTPLHWASADWEGGISNPVYGFKDAMSGIPNRQ